MFESTCHEEITKIKEIMKKVANKIDRLVSSRRQTRDDYYNTQYTGIAQ